MVTTKRHKRDCNDDNQVLLLSNLPDELLVEICSLLTMKEAAALSVLSRRWKSLGSYHPRLIFDGSDTLRMKNGIIPRPAVEVPKFLSWVNQVVKSHEGSTIHEFTIRFYLTKGQTDDINTWVNFSMGKNVKILELDFRRYLDMKPSGWCYVLPNFSHTLTRLGGNTLISLRLCGVKADEESIQSILSNCRSLEKLYFVRSLLPANLRVVGQCLKLKCLSVINCLDGYYCSSLNNIEISATYLISFKYSGPKLTISLKDVPRLVKMYIGGICCRSICELSNDLLLTSLESLTLQDAGGEDAFRTSTYLNFPRLQHLKHLELRVRLYSVENIIGFGYIIQACPSLCGFLLELSTNDVPPMESDEDETMVGVPSNFQGMKRSHKHLKIIKFVGFVGHATIDLELVTYIIESSCMLEKVIFDTRYPDDIRENCNDREYCDRELARECAAQFGKTLPEETEVVII